MTALDPQAEYHQRRGRHAAELQAAMLQDGRLAAVRGVVFLVGLTLLIVWLSTGTPAVAWLLVPTVAFVAAVLWHGSIIARKFRATLAVSFYDRALDRLAWRWSSVGPDGSRYRNPDHPYADDLDLFGTGSLFQLVSCCRTRLGEDRLAAWLLTAADGPTVLARQAAVAELRSRFDLRESVGLLQTAAGGGNQNLLRAWAGVPARPFGRLIKLAATACGLLFWIALICWSVGLVPLSLPIIGFALCVAVFSSRRQRVLEAARGIDDAEAGLAPLADLLAILERETFTTPLLQGIRSRLVPQDGRACSLRIRQLQRLAHGLEAALRNQFLVPLALSVGLQIDLADRAERWRELFGPQVAHWLDVVGDFEALLSLSGYAAEHPADVTPQLTADGPQFVARQIGHPLLPAAHCVRNDVQLADPVRLLVVSGSNMAGKSTLLRSVGLNTVLALAGGPVRAESLTLSPVRLGSVIRVADSLQQGKSLFFAAIERLREVVRLAGGEPPLLFLFDELLAGTNSHDRQVGADAVLRRLLHDGAAGIISTHDLALTEIGTALGTAAVNLHFRDVLHGDTLRFDYTLRPGVVDRGNALALMKLIGLIETP